MINKTFEFEPRFALVMANLKTARELREVMEEEGHNNIKNFLNHIKDMLNKNLTELESWNCEISIDNKKRNKKSYMSINYYFGDHWKVRNDDYICIFIDMPYDDNLLDRDDPTVGLYVPKDWKQNKKYLEKLNEKLPKNFKDFWIGSESESEDNTADTPFWHFVNIEDYAKGDVFDSNGFVSKLEELVSKLLEKKEIFNNTLKQIQN